MKNRLFFAFAAISLLFSLMSFSETGTYQLAVLQYKGGGDWYSNPSSIPNLVKYCNERLGMNINEEVPFVDVGSRELFNYPLVHMTGHGNVVLSASDIDNLRAYLQSGGFLHISDNYGMDEFVRPQMRRVFPDLDFIELPFEHAIYHQQFDFNSGLPKIHEHDNKAPQGLGLIYEGRLVCFYDYECDLGDAWEDWEVHKDPEALRQKAFEFGANMIQFVMMGEAK
ncbi:MAG: DUF4159 domain-containing protein [Flavobacteriales bacterium]|nr:DUF4159 domain-containing protein [Flavobacteriales bacterium]